MIRDILRLALVVYLLSPFLFLLFQFQGAWPDQGDFWWALENTVWQSAFSAVGAVVLGTWGALGLLSFSRQRAPWRFAVEMLCLLPNFLPSIFTLLAALNVVDPFPMGLPGIVLVHVLLNFGLVAVLLAGMIESKMGTLAEMAWVDGAGRWRFLRKVFIPMMAGDLLMLGLFVFAVSFGSFAIPLVVGGGRGTTLEVLIYEKIRLSADWSQAVGLALIQSGILFALGWLASRGRGASAEVGGQFKLIAMPSGAAFVLLVFGIAAVGYGQGVWQGLGLLRNFSEMREELLWAVAGSMAVGLGTGFLCLALLAVTAWLWPRPWLERFLAGYVAPSQALVAFCFLVLSPNDSFWPYLKIPLALALLFLPALWKMSWQGDLDGYREQWTQAWLLGASPTRIFMDVLRPQLWMRAAWLSGLAAVWACGDFALSRILAPRDLTIALVTETLMSGYRLGLATVLSLMILVCGLLCFLVLFGACRVLGRKSEP